MNQKDRRKQNNDYDRPFQIKDVFSRLFKTAVDIIVVWSVIILIVGFLPENLFKNFPIQPAYFDNEHLYNGLQNLHWNDDLVTKSKFLGQNELFGPESLVDIDDYIYTGVLGGRIVRVHKTNHKVEEVVRFKNTEECRNFNKLKSGNCGRFLGLRKRENYLYAIEADTGLYRIDLKTNKLVHLSKNLITNQPAIYNDLVFDPKYPELVYISVSSGKWNLDRIPWVIVEHENTGYVLAYNITNGDYYKLSDGHYLTNGIEITSDGNFLLIAETSSFSIKKINLAQAQKILETKQTFNAKDLDLFGNLLPGEVDNIRLDPSNGDLLLGIFTIRKYTKENRDYMAYWPFIRKSLARICFILHHTFNYINDYYSSDYIKQLRDDFFTGHIVYKMIPERDGAIIRLDSKTEQIKQVLGSSKFFGISEAIIDKKGDLYYGSFKNAFIGHISKDLHQN